ncbi:Protein MAIN-LIKE 2 [Linum grandiflorum]
MERWRPETNTFHMYHGEVLITLQDVAHLTCLSVSGDALYVEYEKETNWAAIVQEVLGKSPVGHMKDGGRVLMRWLHDNFYSCADVEDGPELRQYACAYMLSSIGAFLMPDRSSAYVYCCTRTSSTNIGRATNLSVHLEVQLRIVAHIMFHDHPVHKVKIPLSLT